MREEFARTELMLGAQAMEKLYHARVIVFGVGGVGGHAIEALARCGVGTIDIVDDDSVYKQYQSSDYCLKIHDRAAEGRCDESAYR